jgi:putative PIN family toxin of toxin-antitoxin system
MSTSQFGKSGRLIVLRVVVDTNILVSATIIPHGAPARILQAVLAGRIQLVSSPFLLGEYRDVISRPRITRKYVLLSARRDDLLRFMQTKALLVPGIPSESVIASDPDDDAVLSCAVEGGASYIVSGDPHLQDLNEYAGIRILSPREFVDQFEL